jgi:hypothetical protein
MITLEITKFVYMVMIVYTLKHPGNEYLLFDYNQCSILRRIFDDIDRGQLLKICLNYTNLLQLNLLTFTKDVIGRINHVPRAPFYRPFFKAISAGRFFFSLSVQVIHKSLYVAPVYTGRVSLSLMRNNAYIHVIALYLGHRKSMLRCVRGSLCTGGNTLDASCPTPHLAAISKHPARSKRWAIVSGDTFVRGGSVHSSSFYVTIVCARWGDCVDYCRCIGLHGAVSISWAVVTCQ